MYSAIFHSYGGEQNSGGSKLGRVHEPTVIWQSFPPSGPDECGNTCQYIQFEAKICFFIIV